MLRENKWKLIVSSVLIILPVLFGLIFWNRLPERVPVHWGMNGTPDGWGSPAMVVFLLPFILLLIHWVCMFVMACDSGNRNQNKKVFGLIFWICPVISGWLMRTSVGNCVNRY